MCVCIYIYVYSFRVNPTKQTRSSFYANTTSYHRMVVLLIVEERIYVRDERPGRATSDSAWYFRADTLRLFGPILDSTEYNSIFFSLSHTLVQRDHALL